MSCFDCSVYIIFGCLGNLTYHLHIETYTATVAKQQTIIKPC